MQKHPDVEYIYPVETEQGIALELMTAGQYLTSVDERTYKPAEGITNFLCLVNVYAKGQPTIVLKRGKVKIDGRLFEIGQSL